MRPIKLEMQAFGPYEDKNVIDFTVFNQNDIFLITGTTGAGKTSIFDAISFALYGQASGNLREVDMLRNISASSDTETYVTLTFEYHELPYTITRKPRYMRAKKSGEGLTESIADAELILPSGERLSGVKLVSDKILEILKMDQNQFAQIVMIAQNDFLKFLSSNTSDRKNILRTIFSTGFYADFERELKSLTQIENENLERLKLQYEHKLETLKLEDLDSKTLYDHTEIKEDLDDRIVSLETSINKSKTLILETDKELSDLNKNLTLASSTNKTIDTYTKYQSDLNKLLEAKESIEEKKIHITKLKTIQKELINIDNAQEKLHQDLLIQEKEYHNKKSLFDKTSKDLHEHRLNEKTVKSKEEEIQNLKAQAITLENLRDRVREVEALEPELKTLSKSIEVEESKITSTLAYKNNNLNSLQKSYNEELIQYTVDKEVYETKRSHYVRLEKQFLESQAGLIASKLAKDEPCPVCGSIHHPNLASLSNENLEEEYFKEKKTTENLELILRKTLEDLEKKRDVIKEDKTLIDQICKKHFKESDISDLEIKDSYHQDEDLVRVSDHLEKLYESYNLKKNIYLKQSEGLDIKNEKELDLRIKSVNETITSHERLIKAFFEKDKELQELLIKVESECESVLKVFENTSQNYNDEKEKFELKVIEFFKSKDEYDSYKEKLPYLETYESEVSDYELELNKVKSLYQEYKDLSKNLEKVDTESLEESLKIKTNLHKELNDSLNKDNNFLEIIKSVLHDLESLLEKSLKQESYYKEILSLSQTVSGNLPGKRKIQFETYAQMAYFERILSFANERLKVMSNHQYELVRKEKSSNMQSQGGLDIDIFDHYHGTRRDVGSLSGGELFNASLSLALGLSDVIQHVSGGIKIDALFIDEGFGSLSDEYLENAIQTLVEVAGGDRMIGVISHVKELKDAISNQILITKDKDGSHIKIIKA